MCQKEKKLYVVKKTEKTTKINCLNQQFKLKDARFKNINHQTSPYHPLTDSPIEIMLKKKKNRIVVILILKFF